MRVLAILLGFGVVPALASEATVANGDPWVVEGQISRNPHQHPIQPEKGDHIYYVDTVAEGQLVAYAKDPPAPDGAWVRLTGTVLAFETTSKRPGSTKKFPVEQLVVQKVERLAKSDAVEKLIEQLGDAGVDLEKKSDLQNEIYKHGIDAFPVLIAHLDDGRVYEKGRDVQNYMGMAPNQKRPEPILADVTVGSVCRELLHRMLIPVGYDSPKKRVFKPRGSMFVVEKWETWWLKHRGQSLAQIHDELKPLVDRYYESGGDPQNVP